MTTAAGAARARTNLFGLERPALARALAPLTERCFHADQLYHAFPLLQPTSDLMETEMVYRSHCRELLDRVVAGDDTRPPTHAEVAIVCSRTSLLAPLTTAGVTVYMRAWQRAFPDHADVLGTGEAHYEYIAGGHADEIERGLRRRLTVAGRRLQKVACAGRHHGAPAPGCPYLAPPEQLTLGIDRSGKKAAATSEGQTTAA